MYKIFGFNVKTKIHTYFLGHLSNSGDLLLWIGVRRRPLTSSSQKLLAHLNQIWYVSSVG